MSEVDTVQQGLDRAGKIGASVAHIIDTGRTRGWLGLAKRLWADTGEEFATATGGPRQYGHEHEDEGVAKFWEHHPEYIIERVGWVPYSGPIAEFSGIVGCSPDRLIHNVDRSARGGIEVKSPVVDEHMEQHSVKRHLAQCGHSMMVLDVDRWYLVVHHGETYSEVCIRRDFTWEARYILRLRAFIQLLQHGHIQTRKLSVSDL